MSNIIIKIRKMNRKDIPGAMRLKDAEVWNQTEKDWEIFFGNKRNINLVAEHENKIVGTVTAINYSNKVAWIGMMIVDRKFRGRGVSKRLLNGVIQKLKQSGCKSIKLDATPAGQPVYKKLGFIDEYKINRMTNPAVADFPTEFDLSLESLNEQSIQQVVRFDKITFGVGRKILLESLVKDFPNKSWLRQASDHVLGFAFGRDGTRFHQVGPVSAASSDDTKSLISYALKCLVGQPVVVDILADKKEVYNWLESIGFVKQRHLMRMYLKNNPFPGDIEKQFLICGPEFG